MPNNSSSKNIKNTTIILLFILAITSSLFAQGANNLDSERNLSELQKLARIYRSQGLQSQRSGNIEAAMSLYQKAIELDPSYTIAYNDLGIIYEAQGWLGRAEASYLRAIKLDPNFLSAYSNLALLYENKNDLEKAYLYWKKRVELGSSDDPWTQKARKRVDEITQAIPALLIKETAEKKRLKVKSHLQAANELYNKAEYQKSIEELNLALSLAPEDQEALVLLDKAKTKLKESEATALMKEFKKHLALANKLYDKGEYKQAIEEINLALTLLPPSEKKQDTLASALTMLDKARLKLREQEKEANIKKMQQCFRDGIKYYQEDNLQAAKQEFNKITELTTPPQKN